MGQKARLKKAVEDAQKVKGLKLRVKQLTAERGKLLTMLCSYENGTIQLSKTVDAVLCSVAKKFGEEKNGYSVTISMPNIAELDKYSVLVDKTQTGEYIISLKEKEKDN